MQDMAEPMAGLSFIEAVDVLAEMFAGSAQSTEAPSDDVTGNYAICLNKGDGEIVITALVRRADAGAFALEPLLDHRRASDWRKTAARNERIDDASLAKISAVRRSAADAKGGNVVAMLEVEDGVIDEAAASMSSPEMGLLLPQVEVRVEDRLRSYWLILSMPHKPDKSGLDRVKRAFDELEGAKTLILATTAPAPEDREGPFAIFEK